MTTNVSRRSVLRSGARASGAALLAGAMGACSSGKSSTSDSARSSSTTTGAPPPTTPVTNGDEALSRLLAGNKRFVDEKLLHQGRDDDRRDAQAGHQTPFAIILGCADSRVPPEILFDEGIGDLFLVRVAGNTASAPVVVGSMEYAATTLGCHLLMVLGHEECGAVKAAIDVVKKGTTLPGDLPSLVEPILPAVRAVLKEPPEKLLAAAVRENAIRTADHIRKADSLMTRLVSTGALKVVAAEYVLESGLVQLL